MPTRTKESVEAVRALFEGWIVPYGIPRAVLHDRGGEFTSRLFKKLFKTLNILDFRTTPYHPQANARVERVNGVISPALTSMINSYQTDWDLHTRTLEFAIRSSVHSATGMSSYEMMLGYPPRLPTDLFVGRPGTLLDLAEKHLVDLPLKLRQAHDLALETSQIYDQHRYSAEFRKHTPVDFKSGDQVLLKTVPYARDPIARHLTGLSTKLSLYWTGPHTVITMMGTTHCKIRDGDDSSEYIINVSQLIPYKHFEPHSSHVERAARAVIPNAALEPLSMDDDPTATVASAESLFMLNPPTIEEVASLGTVPLSIGPSPASVATASAKLQRQRKFLLDRIWILRRRLGIPDGLKEPDYPDDSLTKIMHRINDLNEYAIRVIRLNRHYDDLLATRESPAELLPNHAVLPLAPMAISPIHSDLHRFPNYQTAAEYLADYTPLIPEGPLPTVRSLTAPRGTAPETATATSEDIARFRASTDFSRMMDEPRVDHTFLPTTTGQKRGDTGRVTRPSSWRLS